MSRFRPRSAAWSWRRSSPGGGLLLRRRADRAAVRPDAHHHRRPDHGRADDRDPDTGAERGHPALADPLARAGRARAQAAVQEATRSYWSMVVRLAEKPDPDDPQIAALRRRRSPTSWSRCSPTSKQGISQRGPIDGSVTVAAVAGSRATATTCLDQTLIRLYDKAGKVRPGSSGSVEQFAVSLKLAEGIWKVSQVATEDDPCTLQR